MEEIERRRTRGDDKQLGRRGRRTNWLYDLNARRGHELRDEWRLGDRRPQRFARRSVQIVTIVPIVAVMMTLGVSNHRIGVSDHRRADVPEDRDDRDRNKNESGRSSRHQRGQSITSYPPPRSRPASARR